MSPITERDFQSASPLSERVKSALSAAFDQGWHEPQKIHQPSAKLRLAVGEARNLIARHLCVHPDELEFVGELGFGFWSAISGLRRPGKDSMIHSPIDRQIIHAFGREISSAGGSTLIAEVETNGKVDFLSAISAQPDSLIAWQATNREMGTEQKFPLGGERARVFADLTARFEPKLKEEVDVALWDPRSFGGPEGLAILAIPSGSKWRSPIPQIDQRRLFGSYSKPLLLATAVALDEWIEGIAERREKLAKLNQFARKLFAASLPVRIVGDSQLSDPRYLALVFEDVIAEELLRKVESMGYLFDAGSACGAGALNPSHVLSSLGFGTDGHIRLTLKNSHSEDEISELCKALETALTKLRS